MIQKLSASDFAQCFSKSNVETVEIFDAQKNQDLKQLQITIISRLTTTLGKAEDATITLTLPTLHIVLGRETRISDSQMVGDGFTKVDYNQDLFLQKSSLAISCPYLRLSAEVSIQDSLSNVLVQTILQKLVVFWEDSSETYPAPLYVLQQVAGIPRAIQRSETELGYLKEVDNRLYTMKGKPLIITPENIDTWEKEVCVCGCVGGARCTCGHTMRYCESMVESFSSALTGERPFEEELFGKLDP
jgi:hypothetical protein